MKYFLLIGIFFVSEMTNAMSPTSPWLYVDKEIINRNPNNYLGVFRGDPALIGPTIDRPVAPFISRTWTITQPEGSGNIEQRK
ncbi:MAG: hypothetical protein LBF44_01965 [Holosporaceae bacterium]|jgi:hypothetical protein|nr:hypothetical protein [Holosporaceae bacterium]